jgi:hypothetical protein
VPEIRITPGGFVTSKARHMIGLHGASPFLTNPFTIEGFQNLVNYYGDIAWPLLNSTGDTLTTHALHVIGNEFPGQVDAVDVVTMNVMSRVVQNQQGDGINVNMLDINGEFAYETVIPQLSAPPPVCAEKFVTAGTITVTSGSPIVLGAGTAWLTDVLTGGYGIANLNLNQIQRGDLLRVVVDGTNVISFRITSVTDGTHITIYPTPGATNPALGAGRAYSIWRTGYGSYSRVIDFNVPEGPGNSYFYYCGNFGALNATTYPHGTIECAAYKSTVPFHYMSPQLVDSAGAPVGPLAADDIAYYKGYMLYGAGPAISWSVAGAPTAFPFGPTDFPAKNIDAIAPNDKFVTFEYLGDQVVAFFEESTWLVTATGSVPEFAFYKLPERESIIDPTRQDTAVQFVFNHGRPSASGRGTIFYTSNRGIESMGGSLADEVSAPISTALRACMGSDPICLQWDNAADTLVVRDALGVDADPVLIYNPGKAEWSTLTFAPPTGNQLAALTPSISPKTRSNDHTRLIHYAYYETLKTAGVIGTNGGDIRSVAALIDENTPTAGLVAWQWITPVIPLGLSYPEFSTGGFVFDAYSLNPSGAAPVNVTWTLWGGASPYNLFQRDTNTMAFSGTLMSPWVSSRQRLSKKVDDPFILFVVTSKDWVAPVAITLFQSETQAMK